MEEDEEDILGGLYENGRWLWDDRLKRMVFLSNLRPKTMDDMGIYTYSETTGLIEFREDVDLIEQMRYRRYYQRKLNPGQANILTLQDIKDLVLYTAPVNFLSSKLINLLHTSTCERFLRALILYCAYSLQVTDEMACRASELDAKLRTPATDILEDAYRDNLADIRILVAKEYCTMLVGAGDMKPFHHMGPLKKQRSLLEKDARAFEAFIRISVQIVYIALGRKYFNQIELETHRLLKSATFNAVEHKSRAVRVHIEHIVPRRKGHTQAVLLGECVRRDRQLITHSPLMNEFFCTRPIDYRLKGLGVAKYPDLSPRLLYFFHAVAGPEEIMAENEIAIGIIGMPRSKFDTMLTLLPTSAVDSKSKAAISTQSLKSSASVRKSLASKRALYPNIVIPPNETVQTSPPKGFAEEPENVIPPSDAQRRLWQHRFKTMMTLLTQRRRHR